MPAAQFEQLVAFAPEKVPAAHCVQVGAFTLVENVPAAQVVHPVPLKNDPGAQPQTSESPEPKVASEALHEHVDCDDCNMATDVELAWHETHAPLAELKK